MYYVMSIEKGIFGGPYSFKQATKERDYWETFGVDCVVLKVVIGIDGKEVK